MALVLTRKVEQSIKIGEDIIVTVVRIENGRVRLAIEAPREMNISRPPKEKIEG